MNDSASGIAARRLAADRLRRIDEGGAYANILVPRALDTSGLDERDRALVTNLTYGGTRMRRACDWLVDRFLTRSVEPRVRAALRLGAHQLAFTDVPDHAAVATSVEITPKRARGLVNAVLRKVAAADMDWPDEATRLSYPDWILDALIHEVGQTDAVAALEQMNLPAQATTRADGYVQDLGSQWVAEEVPVAEGFKVLDSCAAPGGKSTALAAAGAFVAAADRSESRCGLVNANARRLGYTAVSILAADATAPPFAPGSFDSVLVDAPCSGLGVLRRRPDARWRVEPGAVDRLAELQVRMLESAASCVAPGGSLTYSVCTITRAETADVAASAARTALADFLPDSLDHPERWRPWSGGGLLLPQDHDTDGMAIFRWRRIKGTALGIS
jgi:16S rRNA (cytosine967-C5)-methyltransferase